MEAQLLMQLSDITILGVQLKMTKVKLYHR